ncbi:tetratricopeptide repeat protein [Streptomyces sp. NPDC001002]
MPNLVQREGEAVEVSQQSGTLNPGDRMVGDRYVMNLDNFPPAARPEGSSPWSGFSGAAMFCGDLLAGVIGMDPAGQQHAVLEAVPAYVLLRDPEFAALAGGHCEAIELRGLGDAQSRVHSGVKVNSPAGLLPARRAVVPFRGRDSMLTKLHEWAATSPHMVWLLHGPGGQGKTRLGHQLGEQLAEMGWAVVWLDPDRGADELRVLRETVVPVLVIVDYAETRGQQAATLLEILATRRHSSPAKVLLLARTAGAWWDELAAEGDVIRDALDTAHVEPVPVLDETGPGQTAMYQAALEAFGTALANLMGLPLESWEGRSHHPLPIDRDRTVLAVHMSALADLLDAIHPSQGTPARGPEDRILDHERGYWKAAAESHGLLPALGVATLTDVIAAGLLLSPVALSELDTVVRYVPGVADQPRDRQRAVRSWLTQLYPAASGVFEGLQPDRLAERLIGRLIVNRDPDCVVDALIPQLDQTQAVRLLTICVRASAHAVFGDQISNVVTEWCVQSAAVLLVPAVEVAARVEMPEPLVRAVDQVASDASINTAELERVWRALPQGSQVWSESAISIGQAVVSRYRADPSVGDLAWSLHNLSVDLASLGRYDEGLAAASEATELYRRLAEQRSDEFFPDLANSLDTLALHLAGTNRMDESLASVTESISIYRRLANLDPDIYRRDLARGLNNLAVHLGEMNRPEDALIAVREAVEIRRRLVEQDPDTFQPELADSLNTLSVQLGVLGRSEEGMAAITEALAIRRKLSDHQRDTFLPDLALTLGNLSIHLGLLGRFEDAVEAASEATDLFRSLAGRNPGAFLPDLAESLNVLAERLSDVGRTTESTIAAAEAADIRQQVRRPLN